MSLKLSVVEFDGSGEIRGLGRAPSAFVPFAEIFLGECDSDSALTSWEYPGRFIGFMHYFTCPEAPDPRRDVEEGSQYGART